MNFRTISGWLCDPTMGLAAKCIEGAGLRFLFFEQNDDGAIHFSWFPSMLHSPVREGSER